MAVILPRLKHASRFAFCLVQIPRFDFLGLADPFLSRAGFATPSSEWTYEHIKCVRVIEQVGALSILALSVLALLIIIFEHLPRELLRFVLKIFT